MTTRPAACPAAPASSTPATRPASRSPRAERRARRAAGPPPRGLTDRFGGRHRRGGASSTTCCGAPARPSAGACSLGCWPPSRGGIAALLSNGPIAVALAAIAGPLALWSVRQVDGIVVARRDFNAAAFPPGRHRRAPARPNPRAVRPLLAIWPERPTPASGCRSPQRLALRRRAPRAGVHAAQRRASRGLARHGPLLVVEAALGRADAGSRVPHRRSMFGRWYRSRARCRHEQPGEASLNSPRWPARVAASAGSADAERSLTRACLPDSMAVGVSPPRPSWRVPMPRDSSRSGRQRAVRPRNGISSFRNALRRGAAEFGSLWA